MASTSENSSGYKAFQATSTAIAQGARVKIDSNGQILVADASDFAIGVTCEAVAASGWGTVKMFSAAGTFLMIASVAITRGTQVFPAASGKVAATGTTRLMLVALDSASADGDLIECSAAQRGA